MYLGGLGGIASPWEFVAAVASIVLIDLVLAGDNAVVIAMAVKNLRGKDRRMGIVLGSGGAVLVRVVCTFLVSRLLNMSFVKLIGGAVVLWIAVKLLTEGTKEESHGKESNSVWQALRIIIVADLSMGIDNMLAVGAASHGNAFLLLFGLILSVPMVLFLSSWLSRLMDGYPVILWIGAAVLGKVGGEMMITDPWVNALLRPPAWSRYGFMAFCVVFVCLAGKWIGAARSRRKAAPAGPA